MAISSALSNLFLRDVETMKLSAVVDSGGTHDGVRLEAA
jgi:hypothetical protein